MSKRRFIYLDMFILTLLALISEVLSNLLVKYLSTGFYISFSLAIAVIAMIRWGRIGSIVYIIAGIPLIFLSGMQYQDAILYYIVANAFASIPILIYGNRDRDKLVSNGLKLTLYVLITIICLSIGKGLAIYLINGELTGIVDYFGSMTLTFVISSILLCLLNKKNDLICDMNNYLFRINEEKEEAENNGKNKDAREAF